MEVSDTEASIFFAPVAKLPGHDLVNSEGQSHSSEGNADNLENS